MTEVRLGTGAIDYETSDYIPPAVQVGFWPRMQLVADLITSIREPGEPVVDLGCNAGHLFDLIEQPGWGYDIARSPLRFGRDAGRDVRQADIMTDKLELAGIVAVSEVLEHLADPHGLIARLDVDPVRFVVASSPYTETEHDHYEQHCWAWDLEGFAAMFTAAGFTLLNQVTAGIHQAVLVTRSPDAGF